MVSDKAPKTSELDILLETREKLMLQRDILALQYEIDQLKHALDNGGTDNQGEEE